MNDELAQRFPDMTPIRSAPSMTTVNGVGTTLVGRRDHDEETGTYVKTLSFCLLFVPLIALSAYRVADAQRGWYFIGRVPLSRFARRWNMAMLLLIVAGAAGIAWSIHTSSPEYVAGRRLAEADRLAAAGEHGKAAGIYRDVLTGPTGRAEEARQKFAALLDDETVPPDQAVGVYRVALELNRQNRSPAPDLFDRGAKLAKRRAADDPRGALAILEVVSPLALKPREVLVLRRELLEKLVAADPSDPATASRLAVVYAATGQLDRCEALLAPHEAKLGTLEGAAVLGRVYAEKGKLDRADALLRPYVAATLPALRTAEARLRTAEDAADQRILQQLQSGHAPGFDYAAYKQAPKPRQGAMVRDYASAALKDDPTIRDARQAVIDSAGVVPAALDLGLVQLQRGQKMTDPAARTKELRAAEQTFLSVRGFAQESGTYRLSLGQVYYWLGKPAEGKKEFDELLKSGGRATEMLLMVSNTLREVGATSEARALAEEAYNKEKDPQKKYAAAMQRALLFTDLDDDIAWLSKADPESVSTQASLAYARGSKAVTEGKTDEAAAQYRKAIDLYARQPEGTGPLNNAALCHFGLHRITGDAKEFARGIDKIDRAVALEPSDSILLNNAAHVVLGAALRDVTDRTIDFTLLKRGASWELLPFVYDTPDERRALADKLRNHPGLIKARGYLEKLMVLSPKRPDAYVELSRMYSWLRDADALRGVADRAAKAELDLAQETREYRDYLSGKDDAKKRADYRTAIARCKDELTASEAKKGPTYAVAVADYVRGQAAVAVMGEAVDADELVRLAEQAYAASKSDGAATTLRTALAVRAHARLARTVPEYGAAAKATARTLGINLLELVLALGGPLAEKASADPDVRRRRESLRAAVEAWPDNFGANSWVLLHGWNEKAAGLIAARAAKNPTPALARQIERVTSPPSHADRVQEYFALRMAGKNDDAEAVLKGLAKEGVPVDRIRSTAK